MRILGLFLKIWAVLSILAAIAIGAMLASQTDGLTLSTGSGVIDGPMAVIISALVGAALIFTAGLGVSLSIALVGVIVSGVLVLLVLALLFGLGVAGLAVFGSVLLACSPLLILLAACGLLVRAARRRRAAQALPV